MIPVHLVTMTRFPNITPNKPDYVTVIPLTLQGWQSNVISRSVSRITHDRGNGCRPNMVGMGKG